MLLYSDHVPKILILEWKMKNIFINIPLFYSFIFMVLFFYFSLFPPSLFPLIPPPSLSFLLSLLREALMSCSPWTGTLCVAESYLELLILLYVPQCWGYSCAQHWRTNPGFYKCYANTLKIPLSFAWLSLLILVKTNSKVLSNSNYIDAHLMRI